MASRSVFCSPSEFVAVAIRDNWFAAPSSVGASGASGGGKSVLLKELIHLIGSYFCLDCMYYRSRFAHLMSSG